MLNRSNFCIGLLLAITFATTVFAQYEISWHTVDGGGVMNSTDGQPNGFELSGTIGQPDAGPTAGVMSGGSFELVGGFWAPAANVCPCLGDMNADGQRDGADVQTFVECLTLGGACPCADMDGGQGLGIGDMPVFVAQLLSGTACP